MSIIPLLIILFFYTGKEREGKERGGSMEMVRDFVDFHLGYRNQTAQKKSGMWNCLNMS
jgi:hypothetical protein